MSDFLKNMKMNKEWHNDSRHNSSFRDSYHHNYDRRSDMDRRSSYHRKSHHENPTTIMAKMLPEIQTLLTAISENQKAQGDIYERITHTEERINESLTQIATALKIIAGKMAPEFQSQLFQDETEFELIAQTSTTEQDQGYDKDTIIDVIVQMRDNGATFEAIAQHLDNENVPTFSNRGKWHAQTIHRLYKQNKSEFSSSDENDSDDTDMGMDDMTNL